MSQVLFIIPGLLGLLVFVYKRSPFPNKEYLLLLYPPLLSALSLFASALLVTYLDNSYSIICDALRFLKATDSVFSQFGKGSDHQLFTGGQFSLAIVISAIISCVTKKVVNLETLFNPPGVDFADFANTKPSLIELVNGKIYIGVVTEAPFETNPHSLISVIVLLSGERVPNGVVKYTTTYDPQNALDKNTDDLKIAITLNSIISIREFDIVAFEEFLAEGKIVADFNPPPDTAPEENLADIVAPEDQGPKK